MENFTVQQQKNEAEGMQKEKKNAGSSFIYLPKGSR